MLGIIRAYMPAVVSYCAARNGPNAGPWARKMDISAGASGQHYSTQQPWVIMCVWMEGWHCQVATGPRRCVDMYDVC